MKKLLFATAASLLAFISIHAQSNDAVQTSSDTKLNKEEKKEIRKERKEKRITLRELQGNEVNYQAKQEFYRTYGDQPNVEWTKGKYFDQAVFNKDGISTTAYFDFEGQLVGTTANKVFSDLPASAQKQINKEYKDYTIEKVIFFDDNEDVDTDMILYGSQFDDADNYFVELRKDNKDVVLQVTMDGLVGYFTGSDE